nr:MAG TPA: hypothetical protein [Caudoviricetes sp.]
MNTKNFAIIAYSTEISGTNRNHIHIIAPFISTQALQCLVRRVYDQRGAKNKEKFKKRGA